MMFAMFEYLSKLGFLTRRLAASALVLWLAGVGCLIGCEMNVAAATKAEQISAYEASDDESCPATSGHACCKEVDGAEAAFVGLNKTFAGLHTDITNVSCCQPAAITADPARKLSTKEKLLAKANSGIPVVLDSRTSTPLPSYSVRVPDRGSTHLRCCVFLI